MDNKKPAEAGFFVGKCRLLEFDLFVFHVLACLGVEFHDRHFFGHGFLVFAGGVEVAGASS
jgi:hypothetical protein